MSKKFNRSEYERRRYEKVFKPAYDLFITLYPFTLDDLPDEIWRPIPDYEGYHESSYGRAKSFKNGTVKILKPHLSKNGYLRVTLFKGGKHKHFSVARLVATLFIPNPEGKQQVNHRDGNKFNNHVSNLEWATALENQLHAYETGLKENAKGCDDSQAAFKDEAIIIYIRDNPDGLTREQLAIMFNTNPPTISVIQTGKSYANCGGTIREPRKQHFLTPEQKAEIRRLYIKGSKDFNCYTIAEMFNCTPATIFKIVHSAK